MGSSSGFAGAADTRERSDGRTSRLAKDALRWAIVLLSA